MPLKAKVIGRRDSLRVAAYLYRLPLPVTEMLQLTDGTSFPICPRCDRSIDKEYMAYCDRCGQHLAWEWYEFAHIVPAPRNKG